MKTNNQEISKNSQRSDSRSRQVNHRDAQTDENFNNEDLSVLNDTRHEVEGAFNTEGSVEAARKSGYTDRHGEAVDKAKPDKTGSPTGAYTDIGTGRSSAVKRKTVEDAPDVGDEAAP